MSKKISLQNGGGAQASAPVHSSDAPVSSTSCSPVSSVDSKASASKKGQPQASTAQNRTKPAEDQPKPQSIPPGIGFPYPDYQSDDVLMMGGLRSKLGYEHRERMTSYGIRADVLRYLEAGSAPIGRKADMYFGVLGFEPSPAQRHGGIVIPIRHQVARLEIGNPKYPYDDINREGYVFYPDHPALDEDGAPIVMERSSYLKKSAFLDIPFKTDMERLELSEYGTTCSDVFWAQDPISAAYFRSRGHVTIHLNSVQASTWQLQHMLNKHKGAERLKGARHHFVMNVNWVEEPEFYMTVHRLIELLDQRGHSNFIVYLPPGRNGEPMHVGEAFRQGVDIEALIDRSSGLRLIGMSSGFFTR